MNRKRAREEAGAQLPGIPCQNGDSVEKGAFLGEGGFGQVFKATLHKADGTRKTVALKLLTGRSKLVRGLLHDMLWILGVHRAISPNGELPEFCAHAGGIRLQERDDFKTEVALLQDLRHDNIVEMLTTVNQGDHVGIVLGARPAAGTMHWDSCRDAGRSECAPRQGTNYARRCSSRSHPCFT